MAQVFVSDYFYGDESKEFSYFRIPRLLITHQRFKNVSVEAKLLYGLLLDRMGLSEEHGWYDEDGRVFIYYTVEEIADDLCCGRDKAMKLLAELDKAKGAGLIERVRQGQGKPTKIYVKRFTTREVPPKKEEIPAPISEVEILDLQKSEIPTSKGRKPRLQEVGFSDPSYGSWEQYSPSQHRREAYCRNCGDSDYEYASHSMSYGSWSNSSSSQHSRTASCRTCGYSTTEYGNHSYSIGAWSKYSDTQHRRAKTCTSCSASTYDYANHSYSYGSWANAHV